MKSVSYPLVTNTRLKEASKGLLGFKASLNRGMLTLIQFRMRYCWFVGKIDFDNLGREGVVANQSSDNQDKPGTVDNGAVAGGRFVQREGSRFSSESFDAWVHNFRALFTTDDVSRTVDRCQAGIASL